MRLHAAAAWGDGGLRRNLALELEPAQARIERLREGAAPEAGARRVSLLLPGLPNLHSHAFQRAIVGRTEVSGTSGDDFWSWRAQMYRTALELEPEAFQGLATQVYRELRAGGYESVCEFHYLHNDRDGRPYADPGELSHRLVAAARAAGLRLCLLPVLYSHSGFGALPPRPEQRRFTLSLDAYLALVEALRTHYRGAADVRVGVAAHSLRAVDPRRLALLAEWRRATDASLPFHIHVSEQTREVQECQAQHGTTPIHLFAEIAGLDEGCCLVHATHATPMELELVARSGATVALCPSTEANLGDGLFPLPQFQALGGRWGVGSDAQVCRDALAELRLAEYGQRLLLRRRCVLAAPGRSTGEALYAAALADKRAVTGFAPSRIAQGCTVEGLYAFTTARDLDEAIFDEGAGRGMTILEGGC